MSGVQQRVVTNLLQLLFKCFKQIFRVAAVMTISGTSIKHRVATEQRWLVGTRKQTDVAHCVARCIKTFQFHCLAHLDDVAGAHAAVNIGYSIEGVMVCDQRRAGGTDNAFVATGVIAVFVRIQDLRDRPAAFGSRRQAFLEVEWIDCERLAAFGAGDQVVEVARQSLYRTTLIGEFSGDPGLQNLDIVDLCSGNIKIVPVDDNKVSPFAGLQAPQAIFLVCCISSCQCE